MTTKYKLPEPRIYDPGAGPQRVKQQALQPPGWRGQDLVMEPLLGRWEGRSGCGLLAAAWAGAGAAGLEQVPVEDDPGFRDATQGGGRLEGMLSLRGVAFLGCREPGRLPRGGERPACAAVTCRHHRDAALASRYSHRDRISSGHPTGGRRPPLRRPPLMAIAGPGRLLRGSMLNADSGARFISGPTGWRGAHNECYCAACTCWVAAAKTFSETDHPDILGQGCEPNDQICGDVRGRAVLSSTREPPRFSACPRDPGRVSVGGLPPGR